MIHVIATIEVVDGKRDALLAEFHRLVPEVRAEVGCIEYGPAVDVASGMAAQPPARPNVVTVIEKWDSLDALHAHSRAPHMAGYRERVKEYVVKVTLQVLQLA